MHLRRAWDPVTKKEIRISFTDEDRKTVVKTHAGGRTAHKVNFIAQQGGPAGKKIKQQYKKGVKREVPVAY